MGTCIPAGEGVNWCHHVGEQFGKVKTRPLQPPPNSQTCAQEEMCRLRDSIVCKSKEWKQPKRPSVGSG